MQVEIHVIEGPAKGQHFTFDQPDCFLVGRTADAHISLPDDPYLSRQHFLLVISPPECKLTDLDSKNGVFVNEIRYGGRKPPNKGVKQAPKGVNEVCLKNNDIITVGNTRIKISIQPDTVGEVVANKEQQSPVESLENVLSAKGYHITQELSRSRKGVVYKATEMQTGKPVAIKAVFLRSAIEPHKQKLFQRELDIVCRLRQTHIVPFLEHGKSKNGLYFIFEFVDGMDLAAFMQSRGGCIPIEDAAPILLGTLDGLAYAHRIKITIQTASGKSKIFKGIIHRDLKPQNILLARVGDYLIPKLTQFGLLRSFETAGFTNIITPEDIVGTPMYWPREQITHYTKPNLATDVFSVAAIFYEMLTGQWVREGFKELFDKCKQRGALPSLSDYMNVIASNPPIPIRKRNPNIPKPVADILDHALQEGKIPHNTMEKQEAFKKLRYPDARVFQEALIQAFKKTGIPPSPSKAGYVCYEKQTQDRIPEQTSAEDASAGTIMYSLIQLPAKKEVALFVLDVVGSTQHIVSMGDTYFGTVIGNIFSKVKAHPAASQLIFLKGTGDGFLAVFHSIAAAFSVASSFLKTQVHPLIRVRMALHWGTVKTGPNGDVIGTEVHKVCRIEGLKKADQIALPVDKEPFPIGERILITQQGLEQLNDSDRSKFRPAGTFRLKGFNESCELWVYNEKFI